MTGSQSLNLSFLVHRPSGPRQYEERRDGAFSLVKLVAKKKGLTLLMKSVKVVAAPILAVFPIIQRG